LGGRRLAHAIQATTNTGRVHAAAKDRLPRSQALVIGADLNRSESGSRGLPSTGASGAEQDDAAKPRFPTKF
jgi:hypothetical protein